MLFSFLASVFFDLNNLMEKRAVDGMKEISARRVWVMVRALCSDVLWMCGFFVGIVAVGLMLVAYSLAPIAVVQSIYGAGLVLLVLVSRLYLHETMGRREWTGVAVMIVAVVLVSASLGSSSSRTFGGSAVAVLVASGATAAFAVLTFVALRRSTAEASVPFGVTSGLFYGVAALQVKGASVLLAHRGMLGSIKPILASPYPYLFAVMSVLGVLTFQTGLQRCRVSILGPISNIVASVYVVAVGMAVFHESFPSDMGFTVLRLLGFALVLVGGAFFVSGPSQVAQLGLMAVEELDTAPDGP
ncbi:MAG: hypothetical protein ABSG36_08750 [Acidimicrobiales bacterium]